MNLKVTASRFHAPVPFAVRDSSPASAPPRVDDVFTGPRFPAAERYTAQLRQLAAQVRSGALTPLQLEKRLAELPVVPDAEKLALWSDAGAAERGAMNSALYELAEVAPDAKLPPQNGYV